MSWFKARARSPSSPPLCPLNRAVRSPAAIRFAKVTADSRGRTIIRRMRAAAAMASMTMAANEA
ncbi:hypothetical protein D9M68_913840 [compost metagenome]